MNQNSQCSSDLNSHQSTLVPKGAPQQKHLSAQYSLDFLIKGAKLRGQYRILCLYAKIMNIDFIFGTDEALKIYWGSALLGASISQCLLLSLAAQDH